jgi:hypothetical protein
MRPYQHRTMTPTADFLFADLPGPTRKRTQCPYCFRLTYRSPDSAAEGCALLWEVYGGRLTYQIAVERDAGGGLTWHCTCADHVYRHEDAAGFQCKHVRALRARGRFHHVLIGTDP